MVGKGLVDRASGDPGEPGAVVFVVGKGNQPDGQRPGCVIGRYRRVEHIPALAGREPHAMIKSQAGSPTLNAPSR